MKRTPMNRGSGFARPAYTAPPPAPVRPLGRVPNYTRVEYSGGGLPKEPRIEIPHLMLMARRPQQICLLRVPGVCPYPGMLRDDCCACHGNSSIYGKGLGRKADDYFIVRGCAHCHTWLDTSFSSTNEDRQQAFLFGLDRQVIEWRYLLTCADTPAKDREAVALALEHLRVKGYA